MVWFFLWSEGQGKFNTVFSEDHYVYIKKNI